MFILLEHSLHLSAPLAITLSVALITVRLLLRRGRGGHRSRR